MSPARKPATKWSVDEHALFVEGLATFGKGKWKNISRFMKTRTPTQVASHAQKYFERQKRRRASSSSSLSSMDNHNFRRSIFDVVLDTGDEKEEPTTPKSTASSVVEEEETALVCSNNIVFVPILYFQPVYETVFKPATTLLRPTPTRRTNHDEWFKDLLR